MLPITPVVGADWFGGGMLIVIDNGTGHFIDWFTGCIGVEPCYN
jgi:hypothetical protein